MAYFTQSTYHKYIDLQNVSGSGDPADAPAGGVYLFASGAAGSAKLYLQNEGVSSPLSLADAGTLQIAGDSGTDDLSLSGDTFTYTGGSGIATAVTDNTLTINFDIDELSALGSAGLHQTQDHFVFSDNGTEKKITFSNLQDAVFADVSGDATVAAGGALTIAADAVEGSMLNDNVISGQTELAHADIASADELMISDGGTLKKVGLDSLRDHYYGQVSGDATIADGGALTIAAGAVENSMLADDAVGADELAANAVVEASIVDNAVTLAKMAGITRGSLILGDSSGDPSLLAKGTAAQFLQSDGTDPSYVSISGDATVAAGGALTIGTGVVEHAMLAADCIDGDNIQDDVVNSEHIALGALDAEHYASGSIQTGHVADNQVTLAKMAGLAAAKFILGDSNGDPAAVTMSGDATMDNAGALTIAADSVENSMLANITRGSVKVGGASDAPTDLDAKTSGQILVGDGTDIASVAVSGDVTLAANGAVTIAADAVEGSMLNDNVISGQTELAHADIASADELMISDGGTLKKVGLDSLRDHYFGQVSGDATIADGGALTIAAQAVENSMLADDAVGADELAANAVVNASVASNAAIVATKLNFNVDFGGNVQFGTQSDDVVAFGGPIKVGGNAVADSGGSAAITFDGSSNTSFAGAITAGSGYAAGGYALTTGGAFSAAGDMIVGRTSGNGADFSVFSDTDGEKAFYSAANNIFQVTGSVTGLQVSIGGNATTEYAVDVVNGSDNQNKIRAAAFVTYSDESLKSDVASMSNTALDTVMSLEGVEFTWKDSGERDFGFIAQDVQNVLPKAVHVAEDGVQGVDYSRLTSVLVEAVKAQQVQINDLKKALKK